MQLQEKWYSAKEQVDGPNIKKHREERERDELRHEHFDVAASREKADGRREEQHAYELCLEPPFVPESVWVEHPAQRVLHDLVAAFRHLADNAFGIRTLGHVFDETGGDRKSSHSAFDHHRFETKRTNIKAAGGDLT